MKLNEMAPTLAPIPAKKVPKILNVFKKEIKRFGKANVSVRVLSPLKVEVTADFERWMDPESISDLYDELEYAIKKTDEEGYIHLVEASGNGENFVEALLSGLRPGMKLHAEAFFPTISFEITWKNIMSKKK